MTRYRVVFLLFVLVFGVAPLGHAQADDWVSQSNENAKILLEVLAKYSPEGAGSIGMDGYDEEVFTLPLDVNEQSNRDTEKAIQQLQKILSQEKNPLIRQDLEIMIESAEDSIQGTLLNEKYTLPYFDLNATAFQGIRALLDDRIPAERRAAALIRLRKYAGLVEGYEPITLQAEKYIRHYLKNPDLRGPFKDNLEKDFGNAERYVAGIAQLFQKYELEGWKEPYETLKSQLAEYEDFLKAEVLPRATDDFRLPEDLYRYTLKQRGIDMSVEELTGRAKASFREIQNEMQALASLIAKQQNLPSEDYRDVVRELKKKQLVGDSILPHYEQRIKDLEALIVKYNIVTLPDRKMKIRLASEAESAAIPAPNLSPPRLIGNTGEMGEFVLPLRIPAEEGKKEIGFDDFTNASASWTLTVHEGRPGHELQFASIIEKGVSQARVLFAFNSVNVEGWALYAEAEMKPYMPLDGQLMSLQHRLMRAARAILDPGLQLGKISREEAFRVLEEDVVLSHAMALQEVERYTFWSPGQAPSYFCGYMRLMELRTDVERILGDKFDRKAYHDFILSQGLVPPSLLRDAVMKDFVGPQVQNAATAGMN